MLAYYEGACVAVAFGGVRHGRCVRTMTGGLEMRVLEGASARSDAGSGCESLTGVRYTGFVGGGETEETPGHVLLSRFYRTTRVSEHPFLCYILYVDQ